MKKAAYILIMLPLLFFLSQCAGRTKGPELTPKQLDDYQTQTKKAEAYFLSGSYVGLRNAFTIYGKYLKYSGLFQQNGDKYIKIGLLLALREKELGILNTDTIKKVSTLTGEKSPFAHYSRFVDIVNHIPANTKGITGGTANDDENLDELWDWAKQNAVPLNTLLKEQSTSTPYYAYLFISFNSAFEYKFQEQEDFSGFADLFPGSNLIKYKLATYPSLNKDRLREIVTENPDFYEASYLLGELAWHEGKVLSAEKQYQIAYAHIPASTTVIISLTKVFFQLEEFETCLEYNDMALDLAPDYRDALLGKAMCLGYLGRYQEAIDVLNKMLLLGKYYIGETNYWLSWNQNELEQLESARENITKARDYLTGHYEVSSLDGLIAYKQKRPADAEKHFKEALELNLMDCESAYYLGKIYGEKGCWSNSGLYFSKAADCNAQMETTLNIRIKEIERSTLAKARKDSMIRKKKTQLLQTRLTRATCLFNGAAGYFNAKQYNKALDLAQKAAAHPSFKDQAADLIAAIKQSEKIK